MLLSNKDEYERCNEQWLTPLHAYTVVWAFRRCANIPSFFFDLTTHNVGDWMRLTGPAIRAAVETCRDRRGFVWTYWQFPGGRGHDTVFFLNLEENTQTFFDPSWASFKYRQVLRPTRQTPETSLIDYFRTHHIWGEPGATCSVVDADSFDIPLQRYFEPPEESDRHWGSCSSVCLLLVTCCLRFGCWNLQRMCDLLRACMRILQHTAVTQAEITMRLYCWHKTFDPVYPGDPPADRADGWTVRDQMLRACAIRMTEYGPKTCGVLLPDGTCCGVNPCDGWAMCERHLAECLGIEACAQDDPVARYPARQAGGEP
jgi:hypothetical protein